MRIRLSLAIVVASLLGLLSRVSADTTRHGFKTTSNADMNDNLSRLDNRLVLGTGSSGLGTGSIIFCGNLANAGTTFFEPVGGGTRSATSGESSLATPGGTACDAGDNGTESTADDVVFRDLAIRIGGMYCRAAVDAGTTGSGANGTTFTLRSAEANLSPSLTCTVATGRTECLAVATANNAMPRVAGAATMAVQNVTTENLSANNGWCRVFYSFD